MGPACCQRPDPYTHMALVDDNGEIVGQATQKITTQAVRTAIEAARSLGFENPYWQHKHKQTNPRKDIKMKVTVSFSAESEDGEPAHKHSVVYAGSMGSSEMQGLQGALLKTMIDRGNAKLAAAAPTAP